jgi:hypothetical protein
MTTDNEHIEALRHRLLTKQRELESEMLKIQEMLRILSEAPRVLRESGKVLDSEMTRSGLKYNHNLAQLVNQYIKGQPIEKPILIKEMINTLKAEHGVHGKDKSLYAYIHSLLRKAEKTGVLKYKKGMGFFKPDTPQETV